MGRPPIASSHAALLRETVRNIDLLRSKMYSLGVDRTVAPKIAPLDSSESSSTGGAPVVRNLDLQSKMSSNARIPLLEDLMMILRRPGDRRASGGEYEIIEARIGCLKDAKLAIRNDFMDYVINSVELNRIAVVEVIIMRQMRMTKDLRTLAEDAWATGDCDRETIAKLEARTDCLEDLFMRKRTAFMKSLASGEYELGTTFAKIDAAKDHVAKLNAEIAFWEDFINEGSS